MVFSVTAAVSLVGVPRDADFLHFELPRVREVGDLAGCPRRIASGLSAPYICYVTHASIVKTFAGGWLRCA